MASTSQPSGELSIFEAIAGDNPIYAGPLNFPDHQPNAYRPSAAFQPDASASSSLTFSSHADAPMAAPVTAPIGWATKEAWAQHQADIKQLYVHENKPLPEVMRLMKDKHGFRATVKMYKTHIQQWGLDKKIKEFEMRAIVRKYKQRQNQGKASIISIRSQVRDFGEFIRYCHRKGMSIDDIIARQTSSPTPEAVELSTPVPSPITMPQVLAIPERIFRCVRDYFEGSFESGIWFSTYPTGFCHSIKVGGGTDDPLDELYGLGVLACSLFSRRSFHEARQALNTATAKVNSVISAERPETLNFLFVLTLYFRRAKTDELSLFLLRQFSARGKKLLGSEHPLTRICEWSGLVDASDFEALTIGCMKGTADQFQSSLGPMHLATLFARRDVIRITTCTCEARIQMLRKLLGECEKTLPPGDVRLSMIRGWIADNYLRGGYYAEAKTLIQKNLAYDQNAGENKNLFMLAQCWYGLGEVDLGIATLHKAINSSMSILGPQDSRARYMLLALEDWYFGQGLCDTAAQVRELRQKLVEWIETD